MIKFNLVKTVAGSIAIASLVAITSCNTSPYPGYTLGENGVYSKFYKHDEKGVKPKEGDVVQVIMYYKNSKDSVLFDSRKNNRGGKTYLEMALAKSSFKGSFEDALASMAVGDSASFMIPADSIYISTFKQKELPKYITKNTMLTFEASLLKVSTKDEVEKERAKKMEERKAIAELRKNEEPKALAKYLEDNKITTKPTASGLYYIEKIKGSGPKPKKGDTVTVNYTGRLLDGTVFDTSDKEVAKQAKIYNERNPYEPAKFAVGVQQVIQGWDEALLLMSKGAKAQFIIPSSLAYMDRDGGPIPPYSSLVFDVEMINFKAGVPPASAPAPKMPTK